MTQQTVPTLSLMLTGGLPILGLGFMICLLAVFLIIRPNVQGCIVLQCLIVLPAMYALFAVYNAASQFAVIASSQTAPKPSVLAAAIMSGFASSFCGALSTVLPTVLFVFAWLRATSISETPQGSGLSDSEGH